MENHTLEQEPDSNIILIQTARLHYRLIAFLLDLILCGVFLFTILNVIIIPNAHPQEWADYINTVHNHNANINSESDLLKHMSNLMEDEAIVEANATWQPVIQAVMIIGFWIYFAFSEIITAGSSLGKKVFSLKVIKSNTKETPNVFESLFRAGTKTICLLACQAYPILIINFFLIFFIKSRKAGHDFLAGTIVTEPPDNPMN